MAYSNSIPQAADNPSQSQSQLLANFQAIQTLVGVNHKNFNDPLAGNHFMVTWTDNTGSIPAAPTGTNLNMYNAKDAASVNQLYLRGPVATQFATAFPFTQNNPDVGGWTYLPSAIKMAWAAVNVGAGLVNINLTTATFGANFPGFTNVFSVQASVGGSTITNPPTVALVVSSSASVLQLKTNLTSGTVPVYIFVIGN